MVRPIWSGTLSFGLVNIPVHVQVAVRDSRPRFRMLHATDQSPINLERVCQEDGRAVAWKDLVRGCEYEKGRFVVLTKEDFKAAALEKTRRIDVIDFVKADQIDDRFFETPYYLTAGTGGDQSYALLREAIRASGRTGIAKFIMRDVQHLAAVEVFGDALVLSTLRFANELVDVEALSFPKGASIRKKELDLAVLLVENLAADWKPEKYTDEYRENLMRVIKAKLKGRSAKLVTPEPVRDSNVINLMERLRQSLEASSGRSRAGATQQGRRQRTTQPRQAARTKKRPQRHRAA
jgi:DNA end-binding protein Ku